MVATHFVTSDGSGYASPPAGLPHLSAKSAPLRSPALALVLQAHNRGPALLLRQEGADFRNDAAQRRAVHGEPHMVGVDLDRLVDLMGEAAGGGGGGDGVLGRP